jgi:hypothetical protein
MVLSDLSILLCGRGLTSARVRGLLEAWTAAGLLRDCVWVAPEDISSDEPGPAKVRGTLIEEGRVHAEDLFHLVGVRKLGVLRLMCVNLVPAGHDPDKSLPADADLLVDTLRSALPMPTSEGSGTRLHRINLLVPSSGTQDIPIDLLRPGWDVNAVVSPEDRPDLDRGNVFVRSPGNYAGHAAAAVAAVAGLWRGQPGGCLDERESDSVTADEDVLVLRASVRAVIGEDLARKLADVAAAATQESPLGPADLLAWAQPVRDPEGEARKATAALLKQGDWAKAEGVQVADPHLGERTVGESRREALDFNLQLFRVAGRWAMGSAIRAYEGTATTMLVGRKGDYVVRLQPRSPEEIARMAEARLSHQSDALQHTMLLEEASTVTPPRPETWGELRRTCFSLVDGSDTPSWLAAPQMAGVRALLPPARIAPDPLDVLRTDSGRTVRACDPGGAYAARTEVAMALDQARALTVPSEELPEPDPAVKREVDRLQGELVRIDQWLARRQATILWDLRRNVDDRITASRRQADTAVAEATEGAAPAIEQVRKAQKKLVRRWKILAVVLAVLLLGGIWAHREFDTGLLDLAYWSVGSTVFVFLLTMLAHHQFYKASREYERRMQQLLARRRRAAEEYVAARREANRLELLASALVDWADIIGWITHRPLDPKPEPPRAVSDEAIAALPAAVGVARPTAVDAFPHTKIAAAAELLCAEGFAGHRFDEVTALEAVGGADADGRGHLPADLDILDAPGTPRRRLLDAFTSGEAAAALTASARRAIGEAVARDELTLPPRVVTRLGSYADGTSVPDSVFFAATLAPAIPFTNAVWTDTGLREGRHLAGWSAAWVPPGVGRGGDPSVTVRAADGDAAVRIDVSRTSSPTHVAVFAAAPEQTDRRGPDGDHSWH